MGVVVEIEADPRFFAARSCSLDVIVPAAEMEGEQTCCSMLSFSVLERRRCEVHGLIIAALVHLRLFIALVWTRRSNR